MALTERHCEPCEGGVPPLEPERIQALMPETPDWRLEGDRLVRDLEFRDFATALAWINAAAEVAEAEGHHPDLDLHDYKHVQVRLWTHAIGGLSENDFILAAKLDRVPR